MIAPSSAGPAGPVEDRASLHRPGAAPVGELVEIGLLSVSEARNQHEGGPKRCKGEPCI